MGGGNHCNVGIAIYLLKKLAKDVPFIDLTVQSTIFLLLYLTQRQKENRMA